jgi:hypothetical protein
MNEYNQQIESPDGDVVDCAEGHLAETVYVGEFESATAQAPVVTDIQGSGAVEGAAAILQDAAYR